MPGVLSSRIYLKRESVLTQALLQYYAEPLATFAWVLGHSYPSGLLLRAWKYLLQNLAHDSICGCGVDDVHRENVQRFLWVRQIAETVIEGSMKFIADRVNTRGGDVAILVYNPLNWPRSEVVEVEISRPSEDFELKDIGGMSVSHQTVDRGKNQLDLYG